RGTRDVALQRRGLRGVLARLSGRDGGQDLACTGRLLAPGALSAGLIPHAGPHFATFTPSVHLASKPASALFAASQPSLRPRFRAPIKKAVDGSSPRGPVMEKAAVDAAPLLGAVTVSQSFCAGRPYGSPPHP